MKCCVVIPYYRHPHAIARVLAQLPANLPVFVVNDGSGASCVALLETLVAQQPHWQVLHLPENQGKGAATLHGFQHAHAQGFSHALQVDADGQHAVEWVPTFLAAAQAQPLAVMVGCPHYDESVPRHRKLGRYATHVWVWINTLSFDIQDSMCGFRVYPLPPTLAVWQTMRYGRRMDFDSEILVRLYWRGLKVVNVPVPVRYPEDGVSHFQLWQDNLRITAMHTRLFFGMLWRLPALLRRHFRS